MLYGNRGLFDDDQQHFAEAEYYFEKGLRKVRPYFFDYNTFCKGKCSIKKQPATLWHFFWVKYSYMK